MRKSLYDLNEHELRNEYRWLKLEILALMITAIAFASGLDWLGLAGVGTVGALMLRPKRPTL